ncbi:oligosaccharide flippase family protein [Roseateles saccharophilus]|uniref:oligosaccharide flippase family protein n=1 Tax=Roseateles saccharophilus TaxID=304 RepID=UPI001051154A|nr:oligosaccharide flippase family protein [Roseateles saccharophilus]MDG0835887.1 polysaccharide biosynthesis protein [Roseateles saccharophilus]
MSLKKNILANYISQIYVTLIGIVMVPLYVSYMGAEAYGLVGFFAMLQAWFQLLDMGLTPTMSRETARFNGGATDAMNLRRLLRALEGVFIGTALLGALAMAFAAGQIASNWLNVRELSLVEVRHAVILIGIIVALRWACGLYRGAISGFERLVWLSALNSAVATARFVLVIPFFIYVGTTPTEFFSYQLTVALLELMVLVVQTYRLMPKSESGIDAPWDWAPLRGVLKFSLSIAFTSSVWVMVTQTDKLLLSRILPLADYAYFTLAVLMASGVMIISGPISVALVPRLTRLHAERDETGLVRLYRNATQLVAVIAIPATLVLALFSKQVLWAWTGNAEVAEKAAPILTMYALGNGFLVLAAFPYYLQFAQGNLKLHLIGNILFVLALIPALIWASMTFGVMGAGWAWLGANSLSFLLWVPVVHRSFLPRLHMKWLCMDIGVIALLPCVAGYVAHHWLRWPQDRQLTAFAVALLSLLLFIFTAVGSSFVRERAFTRWHHLFPRAGTEGKA